jgi:hypothetical protein
MITYYYDRMKDRTVFEWTEGETKFVLAESGNRRPIITNGSVGHYVTWNNWEVAI